MTMQRTRSSLLSRFAIAVVGLLVFGSACVAQPLPEGSVILFARLAGAGGSLPAYLAARSVEFRAFDIDGDGVFTAVDLDLYERKIVAAERGAAIAALLSLDLDGDGVVSRDEIAASFAGVGKSLPTGSVQNVADDTIRRKQIDTIVNDKMRLDTNGDGQIDGEEMLAYARALPRPRMPPGDRLPGAILSLDKDGDQRVTLDEFLDGATAGFKLVDADGDGVISQEEIAAFRKRPVTSSTSSK